MTQRILVEKYRPSRIEDILGLKDFHIKIDQNIPHMMFSGIQGSGKTTLAKIIIKDLDADCLTLNASKERGIDVIRKDVDQFASTKSTNGKTKIVFFDEADQLTNDAQASLRNMMESYASNCTFILTCNNPEKIMDPIKSRCVQIKFGNININDVVRRLEFICTSEGITYQVEALRKIASKYGSDIRSSINKIQELQTGVTLDRIKSESVLASMVLEYLKMGGFEEARQHYLDSSPDDEQFILDLKNAIFNDATLSNDIKRVSAHLIAECYKYLHQVAHKSILVEDMMLRIEESLRK